MKKYVYPQITKINTPAEDLLTSSGNSYDSLINAGEDGEGKIEFTW